MTHVTTTEFRVTWRRSTWSQSTRTKSKTFTVEADALRKLEDLHAKSRPDLGFLEVCRLERRTVTVGGWETVG